MLHCSYCTIVYVVDCPSIVFVFDKNHFDKNYGSTFIFWDRIFGTYHPHVKVDEIGIPDNPFNKHGYVMDVFIAIKLFGKQVLSNFRKTKSEQTLKENL